MKEYVFMKDRVKAVVRGAILLPLFVVVTTVWMPLMILKDLWLKSAKEVNSLFDNKEADVIQFPKKV